MQIAIKTNLRNYFEPSNHKNSEFEKVINKFDNT